MRESSASWFHEHRYGIGNVQILDKLLENGDVKFAEMFSSVLQKGFHDFARDVCGGSHWCIPEQLQGIRRRLDLLVFALRNSSFGEVYGNNRLLDGIPMTHMVSRGTEGPPPGELWPRLDPAEARTVISLVRQLGHLQMFRDCRRALAEEAKPDAGDRGASADAEGTCQAGHGKCQEPSQAKELSRACQVCTAQGFMYCRIDPQQRNQSQVVAITLFANRNVKVARAKAAAVALRPLMHVRALRLVDMPAKLIERLAKLLPGVQTLMVDAAGESVSALNVGPWAHSVMGLNLEAAPHNLSEALLCSLRNLRVFQLTGKWKSLPACMGQLTELTELTVVKVGLSGPDSLPPELRALKQLRSIHAFSQDEAPCESRPPDWEPPAHWTGVTECTAGYLHFVGEEESPAWRCPWKGWMMRFDDPEATWWGWSRMERFHVDANFWHGSIPEDIHERWPHLRSLDLHDNFMSGPLPVALLALENLTQLQVQANNFTCGSGDRDVVRELFAHPRMRTLNLDQNPHLCGRAPAQAIIEAQIGGTAIVQVP